MLIKNPDSKKNLSEEDKDMIVNEISLVIQNWISKKNNNKSKNREIKDKKYKSFILL